MVWHRGFRAYLLPNNGIFVPYLRGMKQKKQEPDYRSMNEDQLKYELIKFEKKILYITDDPIDDKHSCPFLDWRRDDSKVEKMMLEGALKHKTDNPDQQ